MISRVESISQSLLCSSLGTSLLVPATSMIRTPLPVFTLLVLQHFCVSAHLLSVDQLSVAAPHSDLTVAPCVVAWTAMGGNADKTGQVDTQRLRGLVRASGSRWVAFPVAAVPLARESVYEALKEEQV